MEKEQAKEIITKYHLIPGKVGRKVLLAIENNAPFTSVKNLPADLSHELLEEMRTLYQNKVNEMGATHHPRNFIFYHLIKEKFPTFSWKMNANHIQIHTPRMKNLRPSLLSLLLNRVTEDDTPLHKRYRCVDQLPSHVACVISDLIEKLEVIYPTELQMQQIVEWIQKGLNKEPLTLFSPICPDYSVEPTNNPQCPYRHTFNELGSGLGLIAKRILDALPALTKAFSACELKVNIIIGIGDFEAYSEANLQRLHITQEEFLKRVTQSKKAFEQASPVETMVFMITEMFGGHPTWLSAYNEMVADFGQHNFGASTLTYKKLLQIVRKRKNLYDRWYGEKPLSEHIPQLLYQGAEYAVLGAQLSKTIKNCLVLGADNDAMGLFYSTHNTLPTLYLKRFYC